MKKEKHLDAAMAPELGFCFLHPSKKPVGVCPLCLRDRLNRLSASNAEDALPSVSQRMSCTSPDSSSLAPEDGFCNGEDKEKHIVKIGISQTALSHQVGKVYAVLECDNEEQDEQDADVKHPQEEDHVVKKNVLGFDKDEMQQPSFLPRSKSVSEVKELARKMLQANDYEPVLYPIDEQNEQKGNLGAKILPSYPVVSDQGTQSCNMSMGALTPHQKKGSSSVFGGSEYEKPKKGKKSWLSTLFGFRKKKKDKALKEDVGQGTLLFPEQDWTDIPMPPDFRFGKSRSVSSAGFLKGQKEVTNFMDSPSFDQRKEQVFKDKFENGFHSQQQTISSLIALDMKTQGMFPRSSSTKGTSWSRNVSLSTQMKEEGVAHSLKENDTTTYFLDDVKSGTISSLLEQEVRWSPDPQRLLRSKSAGLGRRNEGDLWSAYLTPLRTFKSSSKHMR